MKLLLFVESHWGDLVALLVLSAGIMLVVLGPHEKAQHLGDALSAAGLVGLKLRGVPPTAGAEGRPSRDAQNSPTTIGS